ncbi:hypothetical protein K493DRAFT_312245 [Basidiobolus meristosporus CBS 931.73]|uniref:Uncharacterized protein n=1 Tax=Basidiobolus meristosporus CBS 931.73 TaxID=1314790 RepID=A0A1Y1YV27_9FUNG|nr:hypothetical protein K493DRAFT_312245 [Basidiobolus meristosporus CBS 931.73]|eukprot:ORY01851.1 hypothetical protein K493DRAFT_312245 [Basidiobolus meristosporus CBS 931.73]
MVGATLSTPLPHICKPNVVAEGPSTINAGCKMKLQFTVPAHILSTVTELDVKLYPDGSHYGALVDQVKTEDVQSGQQSLEAMFTVSGKHLGKSTLVLTESSHKETGCPVVYGVHEVVVLPSNSDVMCIF